MHVVLKCLQMDSPEVKEGALFVFGILVSHSGMPNLYD